MYYNNNPNTKMHTEGQKRIDSSKYSVSKHNKGNEPYYYYKNKLSQFIFHLV